MYMFIEILNDPVLMIGLIVSASVLLFRIVSKGFVGKIKTAVKLLLVLLLVSVPIIAFRVLVWSRSDIDVLESPTGEYRLVIHWIDQGGAGYWNTEVKIVKPGIFGQRRGIGYSTPLSAEWISDDEFRISGGSNIGNVILSANDIFTLSSTRAE